MTARTWGNGDPEPVDHPPVVDRDGVVWLWSINEDDWAWWIRQQVRQFPSVNGHTGMVAGFSESDWADLLGEYGPVREATADEAGRLSVVIEGGDR